MARFRAPLLECDDDDDDDDDDTGAASDDVYGVVG
jgi:hypothetical protein